MGLLRHEQMPQETWSCPLCSHLPAQLGNLLQNLGKRRGLGKTQAVTGPSMLLHVIHPSPLLNLESGLSEACALPQWQRQLGGLAEISPEAVSAQDSPDLPQSKVSKACLAFHRS